MIMKISLEHYNRQNFFYLTHHLHLETLLKQNKNEHLLMEPKGTLKMSPKPGFHCGPKCPFKLCALNILLRP